MKKILLLSLVLLGSLGWLQAQAETKTLLNLDKKGVAIQGYDPVGFFTENKPVQGNPQFKTTYQGATYLFASAANLATFEKDPAKYEPQFGGYCAYGVSRDSASPIKVDAFQIVNGRLLMQYNKDIRDEFNQDTQGNLKLADHKWPTVVERKGH